ncbi:MAG: DNA translocase FtsK [Oscillospiraceae bacterium]|nr:DNA translocase FtsK [Oscillospiraceae bacterium]
MATTQKKTAKSGSRPRGGSARSGSARTAKRKAQPKKKPIRREVGCVVCLLLALFVGVGYFQDGALLIDKLSALCRALTGWGWYATLPALLLAAWILLMHRGRKVLPQLVCALLLPTLFGCIVHMLTAETYPGMDGLWKQLWDSGLALDSGGALSGSLAVVSHAALGKAASLVVFFFAFAGCLLCALRLTPASVFESLRNHAPVPYEPQEAPERPANRDSQIVRQPIDIPLDGEERTRQKPIPEDFKLPKNSFFRKKPDRVRTPDELLTDAPAPKGAAAVDARTASVPLSVVESTVEPPVEPSVPKLDPIEPPRPTESPKTAKSTDSDVQQAAAAVTAEIEEAASGDGAEYRYPPISLLNAGSVENTDAAGAELRNNSRRLAETLKSFGVDAAAGDVVRGPSVTRYEFMLEQGVKLSKITNLQDDIALALGATGVRIAPIPEKISVVGIEVPNKLVTPVHIRDVIESSTFSAHRSSVCFAVGKDINGRAIVGDIGKFPHVLIAGTTGSGKSVCTNSLIVSMLYKSTPDDVRFIMVDPKMVELAPYNGIPHLLIPVVTDPKKAAGALQWAVYEMMKRYQIFSNHGVKELSAYNELAEKDPELRKYPKVVVVIDELADLMLVAAKEVEESICRVAQMGRAAGMHLVIATQRPSADVITGLMKANIPSRIAFAVASSLESRIILDTAGAEKLVGKGDMLYAPLGEGKPRRVQGCFISAEEIDRVVGFVKENGEASYDKDIIDKIEQNVAEKERGSDKASAEQESSADEADEMLNAAVEVVLETGQASTSMLQRRLKLGYSRAARIVDQMEQRGIVGPFEGSKPRALLITREQWEELKMKGESLPTAVSREEASHAEGGGAQ